MSNEKKRMQSVVCKTCEVPMHAAFGVLTGQTRQGIWHVQCPQCLASTPITFDQVPDTPSPFLMFTVAAGV